MILTYTPDEIAIIMTKIKGDRELSSERAARENLMNKYKKIRLDSNKRHK